MISNKYKFSDLVGNQMNVSLLKRSIETNTFRPFTIFSGVLGTGKSTCARISAMALTCANPKNGEPCCTCTVCKENIKAIELGLDSPYIRIINAGKLTDKVAVTNLVHDIFDLQGGIRNKAFLIEEAHALNDVQGAQTMLLSELDSMPANIYILFSTTRIYNIIEELKSRAEIYTFGRLSDAESKQLLITESDARGYMVPDDLLNLMIKQGKGVPRNLLKALDFTLDENATLSELRAHLQVIDDSQLVHLFESMLSPQIRIFYDELESIKASIMAQEILVSIKSFLVQVTFLIEGDIKGTFTKDEVAVLRKIFTRDKIYKIVKLLDNTNKRLTDTDLDLLLLHLRMIMQERNVANIVRESKTIAATEKSVTEEVQDVAIKSAPTTTPRKISLDLVRKHQGIM